MVSSKLSSLSARPPTPPKDVNTTADIDSEVSDALQFLDDPFGTKELSKTAPTRKSLLSTPEQTPTSSETGSSTSSSNRKKRVNFELQACAKPQSSSLLTQPWTPRHSSPLRPLPQTRASRPLKSILKAFDPTSTPPPADEGAAAHKFESFADMLESMVKMLAQGARPSKLDAYMALARTMQAYEKVPDIQELSNKMGLFSQFIRRDLQSISPMGSGPDTQLITQALKFLMVLVRIPELKPAMDDEFCAFLIDRCIAVSADAAMPKGIINTYLALLMQQNFRPKVMTPARVEKILDALDEVQNRVKGFSVYAYRVRVYRKLIMQSPDVMTKHTERWVKHILKAMLSGQKDIHQSALDTALSALKTIGPNRQMTKSVLFYLNRVIEEGASQGISNGRFFAQQLERLLSTEAAPLVPQVWGTVTAFLRDSLDVTKFSAAADWLQLLENIFKSEVNAVRLHANVAFSFLIYAANLTETTKFEFSQMLANISQSQLQNGTRLGQDSPVKKSEIDYATSGYLTLLYYAFRPQASMKQADRYWSEFVANFWTTLIQSSSRASSTTAACRVVTALLQGSRKPWNEYRALDLRLQAMVRCGELPLLDPQWVRKSLAKVLQFVETLLDATPWTSNGVDENQPLKAMWIALLDSLVEASSKEVIATAETKVVMAQIVNMLRHMWVKHTGQLALSQQKEDSWADKFCFLIETVIQKLGGLQFADKCFNHVQDEFDVAPTPSNRSKQHGPKLSPLLYFVDLLMKQSEGRLADCVRLRVVKLILEPCLAVQNTRLAKLELLRDCSAAVDSSSTNPVASSFWARIGTLAKSCIEEQPFDSNERISRQLGKEYEILVELLAHGSSQLLNTLSGQDLLSTFISTVRQEAGEGAVVLAVIEKVSASVLTRASKVDNNACLPCASILLKNISKSINKRTLDQGRKLLYPSSPAPSRNQEFDPYKYFYTAITSVGSTAYQELELSQAEKTRDFLAALASSIGQSPPPLLAVYLRKLQLCITPWIEDPERKLQKKDQYIKQVHHEVIKLWQAVSGALETLPKKDSSMLITLEPLLTAGFSSRRRSIMNISAATWNATFGKEEDLQYPAILAKALLKLRGSVELSVPTLEGRKDDSDARLSFYESDSNVEDTAREKRSVRVKESPFRIRKSARKSRSPAVSSAIRRVPSRQTSKVRLRHDNSQIQFEPIASSPTNPFNQESQILTERQKDMIERQKTTPNIFSATRSTNESQALEESTKPSESLDSDAIDADDLPVIATGSPLKALTPLHNMDDYLGSSPTPRVRKRSQQASSNQRAATPIAARRVPVSDDFDELGSSPPRDEKDAGRTGGFPANKQSSKDSADDSFDFRHPERSFSTSFDEGTTVDEELLGETIVSAHPGVDSPQDELANDHVEVPSSTVEFQLNAQLDADLAARHEASSIIEEPTTQIEVPDEPSSVYMDVDSQPVLPAVGVESHSTSRVVDSFSSPAPRRNQPVDPGSEARRTRRSARHSGVSSPALEPPKKKGRKSNASANDKSKKREEEGVHIAVPPPEPTKENNDEDDMIDCVVLAPASSAASKKKRKRGRPGKSQTPSSSQTVVPETTRDSNGKRAGLRGASLLSQVETNADDSLVEDTPAPKRSRKNASQDVSKAKNTRAQASQDSQVKRLSHVQVSPRLSSSRASSVAVEPIVVVGEPPAPPEPSASKGKLKATAAPHVHSGTKNPLERANSQSEEASVETNTSSRSFAERVILTPRSLLGRLRKMISDCSQMVLGREEEREIDDAMFDLRREVHAAGRRGQTGKE